MKKETIWSLSMGAISTIILVYGASKDILNLKFNCPMWGFIVLAACPFILLTIVGCVMGRVKRKFNIGDRVKFREDDTEYIVIDFVRFNPYSVVVRLPPTSDPILGIKPTRLDWKVRTKYLVGATPVSRSEAFARYCADKGIKPIDGTIREI